MGRVLLAGLDDEQVAAHLDAAPLEAITHRTTTDPARVRAIVGAVREQGFALVDEELELGLRSLSVPLRTMDGRTLAALNLCAASARVSVEEMHTRYLPAMQRTACAISNAWTAHPAV
jgi:IclR family pca regulon transcriptional regulator